MSKAQRIGKSMAIGAVSGLAASWAMNQYWTVESNLKKQIKSSRQRNRDQQQDSSDSATVQTAERISREVSGHELPRDEKEKAGSAVHYAFGAAMGALYGLLSEVAPASRGGFGLGYASLLWLVADEIAVPAFGLSKRPDEYPLSKHLEGLGAHLVYGATTEGMRRMLRWAA